MLQISSNKVVSEIIKRLHSPVDSDIQLALSMINPLNKERLLELDEQLDGFNIGVFEAKCLVQKRLAFLKE